MSSKSRKQSFPRKRRSDVGLETSIYIDDIQVGNKKGVKRRKTNSDDHTIRHSTPKRVSHLVTPSSGRILRSALKSGSRCMSSGGSTVSFQEMVQVREFSPYQKPTSHSSCEEEEDVLVTVPPLTFDEEDEEMARVPPSSLNEEEKEMERIPSLSLDEEDEEMARVPPSSLDEEEKEMTRIPSLSIDEENEEMVRIPSLSLDEEDEEMVRIPSLSLEEIESLSLDEEDEDIINVSTLNIDKQEEVTEHTKDKKDKQQMDKGSAKKISPRRRKRPITWNHRHRIIKEKKKNSVTSLPSELVKQLFLDHTNCTVSKDAMNVVMEFTNLFLERVAEDLMTYSQHALKATVTNKDCILLLKRQRFINNSCSYDDLVKTYLPMEYAEELRADQD